MSNDEKDALMTALTQQREHILAIADATSEDQLRQPALQISLTRNGFAADQFNYLSLPKSFLLAQAPTRLTLYILLHNYASLEFLCQ